MFLYSQYEPQQKQNCKTIALQKCNQIKYVIAAFLFSSLCPHATASAWNEGKKIESNKKKKKTKIKSNPNWAAIKEVKLKRSWLSQKQKKEKWINKKKHKTAAQFCDNRKTWKLCEISSLFLSLPHSVSLSFLTQGTWAHHQQQQQQFRFVYSFYMNRNKE